MAITKARLISKINDAFRRDIAVDTTDLDDLITDTLVELSIMGDFLHDEATITTEEDTYIYELPDDYKGDLIIKLDDEHVLRYWDFAKYMQYKTGVDTTGTPYSYSISRGYITDGQTPSLFTYLYPIPDDNDGDNYTLRLYFTAYHPRTITVDAVEYDACDYIRFPEKLEPLLKSLLLAKWASDKNLDTDAAKYYSIFGTQLAIAKAKEERVSRHTIYRDI